ncbi:acyl-CoA dehydrogenase [Pseudomonas sp. GW456-E7]|nr:acyl-CoA dehydrogenase [Pseudomonas sp. GW456-E7]
MDVQRNIFGDDHEVFRASVRRFLECEYLPGKARSGPVADIGRQIWLKAGTEGLLGKVLPKEFGGAGDFGHAAVFTEELARVGINDRAMPLHANIIAPCIAQQACSEQKRRWLPGVCSGETILAMAVTEPSAKSRTLQTNAVRDGDHYVINGSKVRVVNGMGADLLLLACRTEAASGATGASLILVEADRCGIRRTPASPNEENQGAAKLYFDNVRVPLGNLLGKAGKGMDYLNQALGEERLLLATFAARQLEHELDQTLTHVQQPNDQGYARWDLQYTRFKLAAIKARAVALRVLVDHYLDIRIRHPLGAEQAAIANLYASETLQKCSEELTRLRTFGPLSSYAYPHSFAEETGMGKVMHETIALAL